MRISAGMERSRSLSSTGGRLGLDDNLFSTGIKETLDIVQLAQTMVEIEAKHLDV